MKKISGFLAGMMILVMLVSNIGESTVSAVTFDSFDTKSAVAGTSVLLSQYMSQNEDAKEKIAKYLNPEEEEEETTEEETKEELIKYDAPKKGIVDVGILLNVRDLPSINAAVVAALMNGTEVSVIAEITVNENLWYMIDLQEMTGYVSGNFVRFEEAGEQPQQPQLQQPQQPSRPPVETAPLPTSFSIPDDLSGLNAGVADNLNYFVREIRYCLGAHYASQQAANNVTGMYATLVYVLEMYQKIIDISNEYGLRATLDSASYDAAIVNIQRDRFSAETGKSEQDFYNQIVEENKKKDEAAQASRLEAEEAARRAAEEAARAAEEASRAAEEASRLADEEAKRAAEQAAAEASRAAEEASRAQEAATATQAERTEGSTPLGLAIAQKSTEYLGLPYVWGGASLTTGADCSGFAAQIYAQFGLCNQSVANYHGYDSWGMRSLGYEVAFADRQPGDLICYNGHVAIYYGNDIIVHEPKVGGVCEYGSVYVLPIVTVRRLY